MFKKITAGFLTVIMLLSLVSINAFAYEEKNYAETFKSDLAARNVNFSNWATADLSDPVNLFSSKDQSISANLYTVTDSTSQIIGYFILEADNKTVSEYAKGDSPYGDFLTLYKQEKFGSSDIEATMYYDGPTFYGVSVSEPQLTVDMQKGASTIYDFTKDNSVNIKTTPQERLIPTQSDNALDSAFPAAAPSDKLLSGVGDVSWHMGCAPSAAANVVIYWDQSYSKLVSSSQTEEDIIEELAELMDTDVDDGTTPPAKIPTGLRSYCRASGRYPGKFSVTTDKSPTFNEIKTNIANSRPVLLWLVNEPTYGSKSSHVVTVAGYDTADGNEIIVHDTWGSTAVDLYLTYNSSYSERTWTLKY